MRFVITKTFFLVSIVTFIVSANGQNKSLNGLTQSQFDRLNERLNLFIQYQREQQLDKVEELLGDFYNTDPREKYSIEQKQWVMEKIKVSRVIDFDFQNFIITTRIFSFPFELRWWNIEGLAKFSSDENSVRLKSTIIAYRQNGDWYFIPSVFNECNELKIISPPEFSEREKAESLMPELTIQSQPDAPIQVVDFVIKDIGESACSKYRKGIFRFRNISSKIIIRHGYQIEDVRKQGSVSVGDGAKIKPGELFETDITFTAFRPKIMRFNFVHFADGTKWDDKSIKAKKAKFVKRKN